MVRFGTKFLSNYLGIFEDFLAFFKALHCKLVQEKKFTMLKGISVAFLFTTSSNGCHCNRKKNIECRWKRRTVTFFLFFTFKLTVPSVSSFSHSCLYLLYSKLCNTINWSIPLVGIRKEEREKGENETIPWLWCSKANIFKTHHDRCITFNTRNILNCCINLVSSANLAPKTGKLNYICKLSYIQLHMITGVQKAMPCIRM